MKNIIIAALLLISSTSFAGPAITDRCLEKAAVAIIIYLDKQEPQADVHLVKDEQGTLTGLTDFEGIYPGLNLGPQRYDKPRHVTVSFHSDGFIVFAEVLMKDSKNKIICKILSVDSGKDRQH
ncbi:MAG: hypothetical protein AABY64_04670 [Bdellovibrionota bacterium]